MRNKPLELGKVHCGDCLTLMKYISPNSVDLVLCDLPYGITACKWDSVIPIELLWERWNKVLKSSGAVILFGSQPFTSVLVMSNFEMFKYSLVWNKSRPTNFLNAKNKPLTGHEDLLVFSSGTTANCSLRRMIYNPQMIKGKPYVKELKTEPRRGVHDSGNRTPFILNTVINNGERFPTTVIDFSNPNNFSLHPTQKPRELLEYLIKTYTNEGGVVLDNCAGSGSTGVAALHTNRQFILIEQDVEYCQLIERRLEGTREILAGLGPYVEEVYDPEMCEMGNL